MCVHVRVYVHDKGVKCLKGVGGGGEDGRPPLTFAPPPPPPHGEYSGATSASVYHNGKLETRRENKLGRQADIYTCHT